MIKKIIIISFVVIATVLIVFFLASSYWADFTYSFLGSSQKYLKPEANIHFYEKPEISINQVLIRVYYCLPQDGQQFSLENWQRTMADASQQISDFYQLQFDYEMEMNFEIYPQVVNLSKTVEEFSNLVIEDYKKESIESHSESLALQALLAETKQIIRGKSNGSFIVNLFVLGLDINALEDNGVRVLGLSDEDKSNSLVFSSGFMNNEFKDFYNSVVAHEIGHSLGVPDFYSYFSDNLESSGVMGGRYSKKLEDNYIDYEIKQKMKK